MIYDKKKEKFKHSGLTMQNTRITIEASKKHKESMIYSDNENER